MNLSVANLEVNDIYAHIVLVVNKINNKEKKAKTPGMLKVFQNKIIFFMDHTNLDHVLLTLTFHLFTLGLFLV